MTMTQERIEKMNTARAASMATGLSPRQIGEIKVQIVLNWIYRWGWSFATVLDIVCPDNRNGLIARMIKHGFIVKTRTESGGGQRDVPTFTLTLTAAGVAEVERMIDDPADLLPALREKDRINQQMLRHDAIVQTATAKALAKKSISDYFSGREMATGSKLGVKQADAMWLQGKLRTALEVELSGKWNRDLDEFVDRCIGALDPENNLPFHCDRIALVFGSPATLKRYLKAFEPGSEYGIWRKDDTRHWQCVGRKIVPAWVGGKVLYEHI